MNKFICTTLAFSMLLTSAVFADGQTLTNKRNYSFGSDVQAVQDAKYPVQDLTVDDAVTKAIANSNTIKTLKESKELAEDSQDDLTFAFSYTQDYATNLSLTVQMKRLQVALQQYDENTELAKQTIDYSVRSIFYGIREAENGIKLYEQSMKVQADQLKIAEVSLKLGQMSQSDYDAKVKDYKLAESNKETLQTSIDNAFTTLNQLMGTNANQTYNVIFDDVSYEKMPENVNVDGKINYALAVNQTVKGKKDTADVAKYALDRYNSVYDTTTNYKDSLYTYTQASRAYQDAKDALTTSVKKNINDLKDLEKTYKDNETTLENMESQLKVYETQLALGQTTQIVVDAYKLQIEQLKNTQQTIVYNHDLLLRQFNNPNLLG